MHTNLNEFIKKDEQISSNIDRFDATVSGAIESIKEKMQSKTNADHADVVSGHDDHGMESMARKKPKVDRSARTEPEPMAEEENIEACGEGSTYDGELDPVADVETAIYVDQGDEYGSGTGGSGNDGGYGDKNHGDKNHDK